MKWLTSILLACLPLGAGALLLTLDGPVRAQDAESAAAEDEDPVPQAPALRSVEIASVEWMAGVWSGNGLGGQCQEHWMAAAGGSMTGMFRLEQGGKISFHQFMLLEEQRGELWLRLYHVNPGYSLWEKDRPLAFRLVDLKEGRRAVFESPDPKQAPSRVTYTAVNETGLRIRIESPNALGGTLTIEALYSRAKL